MEPWPRAPLSLQEGGDLSDSPGAPCCHPEGRGSESLGRRRAKSTSSESIGGGGSPADVTLLFDSNVPRQSCSNPYVISIMGVDTTHENGAQNEPDQHRDRYHSHHNFVITSGAEIRPVCTDAAVISSALRLTPWVGMVEREID